MEGAVVDGRAHTRAINKVKRDSSYDKGVAMVHPIDAQLIRDKGYTMARLAAYVQPTTRECTCSTDEKHEAKPGCGFKCRFGGASRCHQLSPRLLSLRTH